MTSSERAELQPLSELEEQESQGQKLPIRDSIRDSIRVEAKVAPARSFLVRRGPRRLEFSSAAALTAALRAGRVDGADLLDGPDGRRQALASHPEFGRYVIDDEVLLEGDGEELAVDLTPMIDVTFLLLIFFMATSMIVMFKTLAAPDSKADKDGPGKRSLPTRAEVEARYLFVKILDDGAAEVAGERAIGLEAIQALLTKSMKAEGKRTLVLEASARVQHGDMVRVIDAANLAEADKLLFAKKSSVGSQATSTERK